MAEYILSSGGFDVVLKAFLDASSINITEGPGTPTYTTLEDYINNCTSSGRISGGTISDDTDGTITIAAGTFYFKITDSHIGTIVSGDIAQSTTVGLSDTALNYVYAQYRSDGDGGPRYLATTTLSDIDHTTEFVIGIVRRDGTMLHIANIGQDHDGFMHNTYMHEFVVSGLERATGMVTTENTTRKLDVSAGQLSWALHLITTAALAGGNFMLFYNDGSWQYDMVDTVPNTQYNNYGTNLTNLTAQRYGVYWVYMMVDGDVHVVYGVGDYTLAQASLEGTPSNLPDMIAEAGVLIAKIIVQASATNFYSVEYPWTGAIVGGSGASDHGGLGGLGDDDHTQYILHSLATAENDFLVASGSGVIVKKTLAETGAILEADLDHGSIQGLGDDDHSIYVLADGSRNMTGELEIAVAGGGQVLELRDSDGASANDCFCIIRFRYGATTNYGYIGAQATDDDDMTIQAETGGIQFITAGALAAKFTDAKVLDLEAGIIGQLDEPIPEVIQQDAEPGTTYPGLIWVDTDADPADAVLQSYIADEDGDTKIQCEESADEDTIRMDCAGTEVWNMSAAGERIMSLQPAFHVLNALQENIVVAGDRTIVFDSEVEDRGNNFNTTTYTFTAPVDGMYQLSTLVRGVQTDVTATYNYVGIYTSNKYFYDILDPRGFDADQSYYCWKLSILAEMEANDTAYVVIFQSSGTNKMDLPATASYFSGHLAC